MKRLEGKSALIAGAARDIGLVFARRYIAEAGYIVAQTCNVDSGTG